MLSPPITNWHGYITPNELKEIIGEDGWEKVCIGKREFILPIKDDKKAV